MPTIECKLGPAAPFVAGHQLTFERDAHGRYVCEVNDLKAITCLLSVEHYQIVDDGPPPKPAGPARIYVGGSPSPGLLLQQTVDNDPTFYSQGAGLGASPQRETDTPAPERAAKRGRKPKVTSAPVAAVAAQINDTPAPEPAAPTGE